MSWPACMNALAYIIIIVLCACVTTLYGVHDLCNNIHKLEATLDLLDVCRHVVKPYILWSTNAG